MEKFALQCNLAFSWHMAGGEDKNLPSSCLHSNLDPVKQGKQMVGNKQ